MYQTYRASLIFAIRAQGSCIIVKIYLCKVIFIFSVRHKGVRYHLF